MYTPEDKLENIERVLRAALLCCQRYGIEEVTYVMLAKEAGVSAKSVARYFDNKSEMIYQIYKRLLSKRYDDIDTVFQEKEPEKLTGIMQLKTFLEVHNAYMLKDYKNLLFIQEADTYCRYHAEETNAQWKSSKRTDYLETNVNKMIKAGIEDETINEEVVRGYSPKMIAVLCSGLIEHLASDIQCGTISYEESVLMCYNWSHHIVSYIGR